MKTGALKRITDFVSLRHKLLLELFVLFLLLFSLLFALDSDGYFTDTTSYGGDHTFHVGNYKSYQDDILSEGKLTGWISNIYGGMAFPTFYPPLIFFITAFLSLFMPWTIAYKLMVMFGLLFFPIAVYISLKQFKLKWPTIPLTLLSLFFFIFHREHFAFGGNLLSVISGEIAYLYGLIFFVLFISFFYRSLRNHTLRKTCTLLLFLMCIAHPISFAVACFAFFFVFLRDDLRRDIPHVIQIGLGSIFLCGSWLISYFVYNIYANGYVVESIPYWWPGISFSLLFPKLLVPFFIGSLLFGFVALFRFKKSIKVFDSPLVYIAFLIVVTQILFLQEIIRSVRLLPVIYLLMIFLTFFFFSSFSFSSKSFFTKFLKKYYCFILFLIIIILLVLAQQNGLVQKEVTAQWMIDGYENLTSESDARNRAHSNLTQLSNGTSRIDAFAGDVFLVRVLGDGQSFTGLFYHTLSAPLIEQFRNNINRGNAKNAAEIYSLYNVGWIISRNTSGVTHVIQNTSQFELTGEHESYVVFKNNNNGEMYVEVLKSPIVPKSDFSDWVETTKTWVDSYTPNSTFYTYGGELDESVNARDCFITEQIDTHRISFNTSCPGEPHIIKISYFPRWKSLNGEKISLITPSFMLIYPQNESVVITYQNTWVEYISLLSFLLGLLWLFFSFYIHRIISRFWKYFLSKKLGLLILNTHKMFISFMVYVVCIGVLIGFILISNIGLDFSGHILERGNYASGVDAFLAGDYDTAISKLAKVQYNEKLKEQSYYILSRIYLEQLKLDYAIPYIYEYINMNGSRTPELRYLLLSYYLSEGSMNQYYHELNMIQTQHTQSVWTQRAIADFNDWNESKS